MRILGTTEYQNFFVYQKMSKDLAPKATNGEERHLKLAHKAFLALQKIS